MGTHALWCAQTSSNSYATEQSGPGSVSPATNAFEEVEFRGQSILGTPRKQVPVGPDYQAEIPPPLPVERELMLNSSNHEADSPTRLDEAVWPHQGVKVCRSPEESIPRGSSTVTCSCVVRNSMECVRLHIKEKREILNSELGNAFLAWGFDEMGETVADQWTHQEELIFQEVVRKNPSSFWYKLPEVFPSRCRRDLVSYYFNVFVLRRRAIQNRFDPTNVDSDDDEMILDSDDEDSESMYESDEEANESQVDDADNEDNEDDLMSHCGEESGEENLESYSGLGEPMCKVNSNQAEQIPAKASPRAASMQGSIRPCEAHSHSLDCNHDVRNQINGAETTFLTNHPKLPRLSQEESKPELTSISCYTSDKQNFGSPAAVKEGMVVSHSGLDSLERKVWGSPPLLSSQTDVDKLLSTKKMMEEFFGTETWEDVK